jgi:transposase
MSIVTIGIAPPPSLNRRDHLDRSHRWSRDEKLRIVAESAQAGRTASQVARDHGIAPGQLFPWRRQLLAETVANGAAADGFVPVTIASGRACDGSLVWSAGEQRRAGHRDQVSERDCDRGEQRRRG